MNDFVGHLEGNSIFILRTRTSRRPNAQLDDDEESSRHGKCQRLRLLTGTMATCWAPISNDLGGFEAKLECLEASSESARGDGICRRTR